MHSFQVITNQNLILETCHKSTYTERLLTFKSFTSFSHKISLIKRLIEFVIIGTPYIMT